MSAAHKLRWKKLVNQLRYMYEELDIVKDMADQAAGEFQQHYEEYCKQHDIDLKALNAQHAHRIKELYPEPPKPKPTYTGYSGSAALTPYLYLEDIDTISETMFADADLTSGEKEMHQIFTKLFRKLALVLHPDKLIHTNHSESTKEEMRKMFTKALSAFEERRYFILMDYADKLDIPIPKNYKQQVRWMNKELEVVRGAIGDAMRTYNYMFAEAEEDAAKNNIIKEFMKQVFGYDPTNNS